MSGSERWIHTPPRESATFDKHAIAEIHRAAATGIYDIRGFGAKRKVPHFDDLLFLGASISRYPLEGYREKCETGVVLGSLVTLSSVGAGALGTVALLFLYPRLSTLKVVGTDLAHAIPLTAVAGFGHWQLGHVDFTLLGSLLVGSLPGIWIGSHLSAKIPERVLRPVLAGVLMLIGFKFVL